MTKTWGQYTVEAKQLEPYKRKPETERDRKRKHAEKPRRHVTRARSRKFNAS